jgi:hypothetical protein
LNSNKSKRIQQQRSSSQEAKWMLYMPNEAPKPVNDILEVENPIIEQS